MSRFNAPAGQSLFASKLAYEALEIESGEESEEEIVQEEPAQSSAPEEPPKPTKSALKKASRLARQERRQQEKAERSRARAAAKQAASQSPSTPSTPLETPTSASRSESGVDETPAAPVKLETPVAAAPPPPAVVAEAKPKDEKPIPSRPASNGNINGHVHQELAQPTPPPANEEAKTPAPSAQPKAAAVPTKAPPVAVIEPLKQPVVKPVAHPPAPVDEEQVKKRQNVVERVIWTFVMIFGFIGLLLMGHAYMIVLVMLCSTLVYREVTALFSLKSADQKENKPELKGKDPWSKTLNWYFFAVTNYFLYGESIIYYFKHVVFADAQLLPFATNHRMISFTLYIIGFMGFVMSLKKGYLKQQFGLFCWVHMSLLIIVFSSHFIINNILEGLIWFWVPASLVVCNDCFAYIWGKTMGRTPLIKLSPKKTVEGFVGAFFSTIIFAVLWGTYFMRFNYMICPVHDLGTNAFTAMSCNPNPVFIWRSLELWKPLSVALGTISGQSITSISYAPYQLHLLVLACFASLVAPFGGFFASGFKRAFDIKDFGQSIPGHGGMTDRMDCQFLMGVFTYVYYSSLIRQNNVTVGGILQTIVSNLTVDEQLELIGDLVRYLEKQGIAVPR
ncbi:phosphatidate cytidylyltransferase [Coprinopsis cinerea okayama7|uniref:Phosphatidate cytidylyltransferase n=1 Tax=Coprinopsis cinerea (strain Okayama-7 / 130 / ATCC MYA-4618 / FGSC 9003) TaxID=240176 RepID=A8N6Y8_COPC7|nr:phosphatidate cytidylyltransferase [Coprinopsis cinerea okayama7\|eukprot:XP_001830594.1 phosphatidate cytidylyltransferase [Coprinopsis cinerea okayama7\